MSWRHVFDANKGKPGIHLNVTAQIALDNGYRFVIQNDLVYFVNDDEGLKVYRTGLTIEDLI